VERRTVFVTRKGGYQSQAVIYRRAFLPILKKAGLPRVRPYTMRHTCATLLLASEVSIMAISRRLGHEKIETTLKHYSHLLPTMQERAVQAMEGLLGPGSPTIVPQEEFSEDDDLPEVVAG
jgi:integrase